MDTSELRSRYVMAGRIRTHYSEAGCNGPAVVFCHGGGPGSSGEAGFGRIMPALATRFQVYAIDSIGGFGETDPYALASEGVQSRVYELELFIDALGFEQVFLSGNSQGAWVAAKYALEHPDRVSKLALIASSTIAQAMGIKTPVTEGMRAIRAYDGSPDSMRRFLQTIVYNQSLITDNLVSLRNETANRPGASEARRIFQEGTQRLNSDPNLRLNFEMIHNLPRLTIPMIFIWGEDDRFAPMEIGKELERLLPSVRFHYIAQAGHQVQNDQPEVVSKLMLEFFGS